MTRKEANRQATLLAALASLGFTNEEAKTLRRISNTLRRWFELECGNSNDWGSWVIERDGNGPPYMVHRHYQHESGKDSVTRRRIPDRETGARKRLTQIIDLRNGRPAIVDGHLNAALGGKVTAYIQTDPRGAALYLLCPDDVPESAQADGYYQSGICVY